MSGINEGSDIYEESTGGGTVDQVNAGLGISVDNTDPAQPVVSANLAAGSNVTLATLPGDVIEISAAPGGTVDFIQAGDGIDANNSDPQNPTITAQVRGYYNTRSVLDGPSNFIELAQIGSILTVPNGGTTTPAPGWNVALFVGSDPNSTIELYDLREQLNAKYSITSGIPFLVINQGTSPMKVSDIFGTFNGSAGPYILQAKSTLLLTSGPSASSWLCQQIGPIADNLKEITLTANAGTWNLNDGWSAFPSATFAANTTITITNPQRGKMSLYVTQDTVVRDLTFICNGVTFVVGGSNVVGSNSVTIGSGEFTAGPGARYVINLDFVAGNTCWIVVNH